MKTPTRKQLWWTAGLAAALLLALTVAPGINYNLEGPGDALIWKTSQGWNNEFVVRILGRSYGYRWRPSGTHLEYWGPEGFSTTKQIIYFRQGTFEVVTFHGDIVY